MRRPGGRDVVATILAVAIGTALNMWDALRSDTPGLSENATQVITALGSGIIGVLGGYIGGRAVEQARQQAAERQREEHDSAPPDVP